MEGWTQGVIGVEDKRDVKLRNYYRTLASAHGIRVDQLVMWLRSIADDLEKTAVENPSDYDGSRKEEG
jgi:hypothetical protein